MTFLPDSSPASTPTPKLKLSLFSFPFQPQEPPGMLTPPPCPPSSIPFLWEEAPGKPRLAESSSLSPTRCNTTLPRCLELPPRLLAADATAASSPSTVLDGPYVGRSMSHSTVFRRERFDDVGLGMSKGKQSQGNNNNNNDNNNNSGYFVGLGRKFGSMRHTRVWESSSPSSSSMSEYEGEKKNGVTITRSRRHRSFFRSYKSRSTTHILAGIFGTFKQVVPLSWRTRKIKKDGHFI